MNVNEQIKAFFKKEYRGDMAETAIFLAAGFVKETNSDWNTESGRKKIIQHIREFCDEGSYSGSSHPELLRSDDDTFMQAFAEGLDSNDKNTPEGNDDDTGLVAARELAQASLVDVNKQGGQKNVLNNKGLHELSYEASEVLKKIDSEAYESPALNNLTRMGVLKQFRKAMIMLWVARNKAPNV